MTGAADAPKWSTGIPARADRWHLRDADRLMALLKNIGREFSGYNLLESGKRIFDRKPLQCSLYLTDKCNLDSSYCTEYDNRNESDPRRSQTLDPQNP